MPGAQGLFAGILDPYNLFLGYHGAGLGESKARLALCICGVKGVGWGITKMFILWRLEGRACQKALSHYSDVQTAQCHGGTAPFLVPKHAWLLATRAAYATAPGFYDPPMNQPILRQAPYCILSILLRK